MTENFLWGVATSAYQIEGAPENDWTEWERLGRLKEREVRCGVASGHRERWRQDLSFLPAIGANAYRYSIRVEPPGAASRRVRYGGAGVRVGAGRLSARVRDRAGRHASPLHASRVVLEGGWLGEQGQRRVVSPSRGEGRRCPAGRPHLGHGQRADHLHPGRLPWRADPSRKEEFRRGGEGSRAPPARANGGRAGGGRASFGRAVGARSPRARLRRGAAGQRARPHARVRGRGSTTQ